jgi:hypothetical protein
VLNLPWEAEKSEENMMKKTMMAVAALSAAVAFADGIVSSDIVGYTSKDLTKGAGKLSMVAGSFNGITTDGFQMNGNMVVENVKGSDYSGTSDQLLLWDPTKAGGAGGYTTFYYYDDGTEAGWCDPATDDYVEKSAAYANGFPAGSAFWFKAVDGADKDITFSGAIEDADYIEPPLSEGTQLSMVADAYPVPLKLNETSCVKFIGIVGSDYSGTSDQLLLWDPTKAGGAGGYTTFYYYDDGTEAGWCDPATDDYVENTYPAGFPVGTAFWFKPYTATGRTIRFNKNF